MKAKLLKKIRKRFIWYERDKKTPGTYVLIDTKLKNVIIFDKEYCMQLADIKSEEEYDKQIKCKLDEWCFRWLKTTMLKPFGYNWGMIYDNRRYRKAVSIAKKRNRL